MTDTAILLLGCSVSMLTLGAGYIFTRNHFLASFRQSSAPGFLDRPARSPLGAATARDAATTTPTPLYAAPQNQV